MLNEENLSLIPISAAIGFILGLIVIEGGISNPPIDLINTIVTGVAVLFASLGGAFYAFRLHDDKERKSELKGQIAVVNDTLFALLKNWSSVFEYRKNVINPIKDNENIWLVMGVNYEGSLSRKNIPLGNLSFLNNRKNLDILFKLNNIEQLHDLWNESVIRRSHLRDSVISECENVSVVEGDDNTLSIDGQLSEISNTDRSILDVMTRRIINEVDHLIDKYQEAINLFTDRMSEIYGVKNIIAVKIETINSDEEKGKEGLYIEQTS